MEIVQVRAFRCYNVGEEDILTFMNCNAGIDGRRYNRIYEDAHGKVSIKVVTEEEILEEVAKISGHEYAGKSIIHLLNR